MPAKTRYLRFAFELSNAQSPQLTLQQSPAFHALIALLWITGAEEAGPNSPGNGVPVVITKQGLRRGLAGLPRTGPCEKALLSLLEDDVLR